MTGLGSILSAFFLLAYVAYCAFTAVMYMKTENVPAKGQKRAYYLYVHGKIVLYVLDAVAVGTLIACGVLFLAKHIGALL